MGRLRRIGLVFVVVVCAAGVARIGPAAAQAEMSVAAALAAQDGRSASVGGYVVGQPVATNSVLRSGFTGDTAIAIADSAGETGTARMLYVQVTSGYRASFGLRTNPGRIGQRIVVAGRLTAYFSHGGLKEPTSMTGSTGSTPSPSNPGSPPPTGDGGNYYAAAEGKSGPALRASLHGIIRNHTKISYSQVWTALQQTDQDPGNSANVVLLYSGRSQSKSSNGGNANDWNREHVWPQSHGNFGTAAGPGTDLHHLRPEDVSVNSTRGNKDFDAGGSSVSECPGCRADADSFEPRDAVKGDVARMLMYMAIRYEGGSELDLELNDSVNNGSAPRTGRLSVLLQWHNADPPDAQERRRNEIIFTTWQHNRNPFIDHPEWAASIFTT